MRLILDRPYHYTIPVNGGRVHGSEPFEASPRTAAQLLARYAPVLREATVSDLGAGAPEDALSALSRKDLNAHAQSLGVPEPEKLANKDAVIAAIRGTEPAPVAGDTSATPDETTAATDGEAPEA